MTLIKDRDLFLARGGPRVYLFSCSLSSQCHQSHHVWVHTHTHSQAQAHTYAARKHTAQLHCISVVLSYLLSRLSSLVSFLFLWLFDSFSFELCFLRWYLQNRTELGWLNMKNYVMDQLFPNPVHYQNPSKRLKNTSWQVRSHRLVGLVWSPDTCTLKKCPMGDSNGQTWCLLALNSQYLAQGLVSRC